MSCVTSTRVHRQLRPISGSTSSSASGSRPAEARRAATAPARAGRRGRSRAAGPSRARASCTGSSARARHAVRVEQVARFAPPASAHAIEARVEGEVLAAGQLPVEQRLVAEEPDPRRAPRAHRAEARARARERRPACGEQERPEHPQKRRLAGAVRTEDRKRLAGGERDIVTPASASRSPKRRTSPVTSMATAGGRGSASVLGAARSGRPRSSTVNASSPSAGEQRKRVGQRGRERVGSLADALRAAREVDDQGPAADPGHRAREHPVRRVLARRGAHRLGDARVPPARAPPASPRASRRSARSRCRHSSARGRSALVATSAAAAPRSGHGRLGPPRCPRPPRRASARTRASAGPLSSAPSPPLARLSSSADASSRTAARDLRSAASSPTCRPSSPAARPPRS